MGDKIRVIDLFAGAGGFTIACEMAEGYETVAFCEIDSYAQKVLAKNWPDVPIFSDVTKLKADDIAGTVDVITGGFPCQDLSAAGAGAGIGDGTRSGLFREMLRIAQEFQIKQGFLPYIVFENVPRLLSGPSENPGNGLANFSGRWPKSGMMRNGFVYPLPALERRISGNESALLPTPRKCSAMSARLTEKTAAHQYPNLEVVIARRMLPTPTKHLSKEGAYPAEYTRNTPTLTAQLAGGRNGVVVNPRFVEWMMGFPKDHTIAATE